MLKTICKIFPLLLLVISCAEPDRKDADGRQIEDSTSIAETPDKTDGNNDTLLHEKYRYQYEQVSYESLDDTFLKKVLAIYFVCDYELEHTDFICTCDKSNSDNDEHASDYIVDFNIVPFDSTKHKISRDDNGFVYLIDDRVFWGTEGWLPNTQIASFIVKCKTTYIRIPRSEYCDLYTLLGYNDQLKKIHFVDSPNSYIVLMADGGDGSYHYTVAWIFKNGKYYRRIVDSRC